MERREHSGPMSGARFVDPTVLARIGNLDLIARHVVDGFINGLHRAPHFGASIDGSIGGCLRAPTSST
jgi:hypothetical protein